MSVSVLICTRNRKEFVQFMLGELLRQLRPGDQVVLVDDGSDPQDAEVLSEYWLPCEKTLIRHESSRGSSASRNEGLLACRHECVVQLDSDAWLVDDGAFPLFEEFLATLPEVGAIALPVHYHFGRAPQGCGSVARRWILRDLEVECSFFGCGCVLRRSAVVQAGLYPMYLRYGPEEDALSLRLFRLGYEVRACTRIRAIHGHEVLSARSDYLASRDRTPEVDVAGSQLCLAAECLARPWARLYGGWVLAKAIKKGLSASAVLHDFRRKRSQLDPLRFRLTSAQTLRWMALRVRVRVRGGLRYLRARRGCGVK